MKNLPVSCNKDCGGGCPLIAHTEGGRVVRITNNPLGTPYMKGCLKGFRAMELDHHTDRLVKPLVRLEGRPRRFVSAEESRKDFREAGWDEALDLAARKLADFKNDHGCRSLLDLSSGGACRGALHNNSALTSRFLTLWGGAFRTYSNYSSGAASFALPYVFGTKMTGMDAGNLAHSKLIILWGYNAFDTRFGCEMSPRILEAKKRGVPVVVIDPRRTRTADVLGTWWIPVRPGSDTALMAAILYHIIRCGLQKHDFIDRYSRGFEELKAYVLGEYDGTPKSPAWASEICGVPAEDIEKLAGLYARTSPAALLPGLSLQRSLGGEEAARMTCALQLATGNIGIPGGSSGGMIWGKVPGPACPSLTVPPHDDPSVPVYEWPDEILKGGIKGAYITGSNLLAQGSDLKKNIRAFGMLDLIIGHDFFLTPTMALCDIVFPAASFLEREDIVFPAGNFLLYSAKAAEPPAGVLTDYGIFTALAGRLGFADAFTEGRSEEQWIDHFLEESDVVDIGSFKKTGLFIGEEQERNAFSSFINDPLSHPLATPSGKIEISPAAYGKLGFPAYPHCRNAVSPGPVYPLCLITPHPLQGIHSQYANLAGFRMEEDHVLWMNTADAAERGISEDGRVRVTSAEGELEIAVRVTDRIRTGTVSLNEGLWPVLTGEPGKEIDLAGSANILTSTEPTLPSRCSRTHTIFVQVQSPV